ncbi:MAG: EAL domain-containing protein [Carboxydocellales bacterium]|jgi:EAL domain-containing protein (putative c-di-GMP-specific phosphodiesterase class I)
MTSATTQLINTISSWFWYLPNKSHNRKLLHHFRQIISEDRLRIEFQPIVSLDNAGILGWEALTRGPVDSYFASPLALFSFAEEAGMLYPLERTCRHMALRDMPNLECQQKLFINIDPQTINDPHFIKGETKAILESLGLTPANIVFELTERRSIQDFPTFRKSLKHYRDQGYLIAIDDAGAGYSSLQSIVELHPDYIKMDMSLVRNVDTENVKRALLETFVTFARKVNCEIIAEGIETPQELETLINLGINNGQGYYLARPAHPPLQISHSAVDTISGSHKS